MAVETPFEEWTRLMRLSLEGDDAAYARVLAELAAFLRRTVRQGFARSGLGPEEVEDVVQETLLAIHLKRHTWDPAQPLVPWVRAVATNKLIDNLRRRGRHVHVPVDDLAETLGSGDGDHSAGNALDADRLMARLAPRQREIVRGMTIEGRSAREVGDSLGMKEGAVRVALHRALKDLAAFYREGST